jgi:protein SCO1/2
MRNRIIFVCAAAWFAFLVIGCRSTPEQRYALKGKVVAVNKSQPQVTVAHEAIPGFMDAMTMPFDVREDWAISILEPGQEIEATLVIKGEQSWIEGLKISQTKYAGDSTVSNAAPEIGAEVPDFKLLNQDGKRIHLSQYRGKPLLLTFIYTRCPLPNYCPRTSKNFSEIFHGMQSVSPVAGKPHLLTVSFDTENDTPEVLRKYGRRYMNPAAFEEWEFATGSPEEIKEITSYFGLSYLKESGQIIHSLVTALIGPNGKLVRLYLGNEWTSSQILAEFR